MCTLHTLRIAREGGLSETDSLLTDRVPANALRIGVALDFAQQVESHLITRHYEVLSGARGSRIRARNA